MQVCSAGVWLSLLILFIEDYGDAKVLLWNKLFINFAPIAYIWRPAAKYHLKTSKVQS